ncbi:hypothetical protein [uncultured Psychroserpens sp.]|nr:hypothetical protein [uncultured Psychroserpens sp.]
MLDSNNLSNLKSLQHELINQINGYVLINQKPENTFLIKATYRFVL